MPDFYLPMLKIPAYEKILFVLAAAFLLLSCTNYGDKLSKDFMEVYFKDGVSKEEAQKALDYFLPR